MPQPWERQPGETSKAYAAFCRYRKLPPERRSLALVASKGRKRGKTGEKPKTSIEELSAQHDWVARAAAYDDHLDSMVRAKLEKQRLDMAERQADVARAMLDKARERIASIPITLLGPQDVARWVDVATKTERLALGEPTDNVREEVHGSIDLGVVEQYSAEELREIALFESEHPMQGPGAAEPVHPAQADTEAGDIPPQD